MIKPTDIRPLVYTVDNLPDENSEYQILRYSYGYYSLQVWDYEDQIWRPVNKQGTIEPSEHCIFDSFDQIVEVINKREFSSLEENTDDPSTLASPATDF